MSDDERKIKQCIARVDMAMQWNAKIHDELLAIKRALEGSNPVGEILAFFDELWMKTYNASEHYQFNRTVEPAHVKRLLKVFDVATMKRRITLYLGDSEPFLVKQKHPFNLFISRINTYTRSTAGSSTTFDAVPGCAHVPPCGTDAEHTRRRMSEMRG